MRIAPRHTVVHDGRLNSAHRMDKGAQNAIRRRSTELLGLEEDHDPTDTLWPATMTETTTRNKSRWRRSASKTRTKRTGQRSVPNRSGSAMTKVIHAHADNSGQWRP